MKDELSHDQLARTNRWLFVSDVDDTLLGDVTALAALSAALGAVRTQLIIAYNSSRPCASLRKSLAMQPHLPPPDYLVGALGTEIERGRSARPVGDYSRRFVADWQREKIATLMDGLGFAAHATEYQTAFKASYHVPGNAQYRQVLEQLDLHGIQARVIYSGHTNLDIIPAGADKGQAADYLRRRLRFRAEQVIVAGDSGNDREMFVPPFRGIVVANADADLQALSGQYIYHARASYAAGVLEGLQYWGVLPRAPAGV